MGSIPTRWWIGGGVACLLLITVLTIYALQPMTDEGVAQQQPLFVPSGDEPKVQVEQENIPTVTDAEIDKVFEEMRTLLERSVAGPDKRGPRGKGEPAIDQFSMMEEQGFEEKQESGDEGYFGEEEQGTEEGPPPESVVDDFLSALHNLDLDSMLAMSRGQARTKLEELRQNAPPPEARAMFSMIQVTGGRRVNDDEYRFRLSIPAEDNSPEIVMRRDGGQWWIDEIND